MACKVVEVDYERGHKDITVCDAKLPPHIEGVAYPYLDLAFIDPKERPKEYVEIHEIAHNLWPEKTELEILKIADEEYKNLTGKDIDTYGDYVRAIKSSLIYNILNGLDSNYREEIIETTQIGYDILNQQYEDFLNEIIKEDNFFEKYKNIFMTISLNMK